MWKRLPPLPRPLASKRPMATGQAGWATALPAILCACLLLGACQNDQDPGPGGVTVGEARALDEAAKMLDEQRLQPQPSGTESPAAD